MRVSTVGSSTARRKASFTAAVYATANPSVRHTERCGLDRHVAQCSSYLVPRMADFGRPCPDKM